jgi:hypothetical protein
MAKVRGCIGESTVDFRQLAKFQEIYWRKYSGLSPIGETPGGVLAKVRWTLPVVTKQYQYRIYVRAHVNVIGIGIS